MEEEITRETLIAAARKAAEEHGDDLTRADFQRISGISPHHIYRLFPEGGWKEVRRKAGLGVHPRYRGEPLDDDQLLAEFHQVTKSLGVIPTWAVFAARADISSETIRRRFGGIKGTLKRYKSWLEDNHPDSPMLEVLEKESEREMPMPATGDTQQPSEIRHWEQLGDSQYGSPLDFRGLRHAPINEQGVVFLFGMVSYELGFIVEAVHAAYPDCEAKRCVDNHGERWERVRIEFEYKSSNFRDHGHDPSLCDLIVCWVHDWPECPLEVVELRNVLHELEE